MGKVREQLIVLSQGLVDLRLPETADMSLSIENMRLSSGVESLHIYTLPPQWGQKAHRLGSEIQKHVISFWDFQQHFFELGKKKQGLQNVQIS